MKSNSKIVLCKMFSGNYWEDSNNIGYESINLFLPDGEAKKDEPESYIYLPAYGDYDLKNKEIKYVILTQHIAKKRPGGSIVKILGMAEVKSETLKNDYLYSNPSDPTFANYKCISGIEELKKLYKVKKMYKVFFSGKSSTLYDKAKILNEIHVKQIKNLNSIKYSGIKIEDIFKKNYLFGDLNILVSLKVKNLSIPTENIYLTNDNKNFSGFIQEGDYVITLDSSPSAQSQTTFIDYSDEFIKKIRDYSGWKSAKELNIKKFGYGFDQSFLTIIKKEYDELSYSNLFAYFFRNIEFLKYFFTNLDIPNINTIKKVNIVREENRIDILIKSKDIIIVIENKIKSTINGHPKEDINGKKFKDQLVRYYEYIEDKYKKRNRYYFIFAPDYNYVNEDNFGKSGIIEMKAVWHVVRYSEISLKCGSYKGFKGTGDEWYYDEFKKALKVHSVNSLNYYRDMQIRMSNLI